MAETAAAIEDEDEFFLAVDDAAANDRAPSPRDQFHTPLPPDVMEEIQQITHKLMKFKEKKNPEMEDTLQLFINEWRSQTEEEIDELKKLKERVSIRKSQRAEEAARFAEMMREEEEMRIQMAEEERIRKQEAKIERLREAELKRQKMMEEQTKGRNFKIASTVKEQAQEQTTTKEPTKEEYEAMKEAALSVIIKPLEIGGLRKERLKRKCQEMWDKIIKLETERYDLEEKRTRQEYDMKELKERQKQQLRQKALKLGLEPEALTGKYPPKIRVASKYERRKGLRPFGETKGLFEGGFITEYNTRVDDEWQKRQEVFTKRNPEELPPWLADMPRQTIKQIEEEEAAIKAVISKEEVEGKEQPENENEEGEAAAEEGEKEEGEAAEGEGEEEEEEASEVAEDDGVKKKEIVITDAAPEAEEQEADEADSVAATTETGADDVEEVAEEEGEEEEEASEVSEATPQQPSPAKQQEEELAEEEEEEESQSVEVAPQEEEEEEEEEA